MGRIAASIASRHGFANPFQTPTGPTAWRATANAIPDGGVFKELGIYSLESAFVAVDRINMPVVGDQLAFIFLVARSSCWETVAVASRLDIGPFPLRHLFGDIKWMWGRPALGCGSDYLMARVSMEDTGQC